MNKIIAAVTCFCFLTNSESSKGESSFSCFSHRWSWERIIHNSIRRSFPKSSLMILQSFSRWILLFRLYFAKWQMDIESLPLIYSAWTQLIDTSRYCIYCCFIQITMHLIETSNIQTLFRTANYRNPNNSVVVESWLVSHIKSLLLLIWSSCDSSVSFLHKKKTCRNLLYLHRVHTGPGEGEWQLAPLQAIHSWEDSHVISFPVYTHSMCHW